MGWQDTKVTGEARDVDLCNLGIGVVGLHVHVPIIGGGWGVRIHAAATVRTSRRHKARASAMVSKR